jgi:zinc/manganese transport system substrate-binding protein
MTTSSSLRLLLAAPVAALALVGCGDDTDAADDGVLTVVASTNVYGDIAAAVAGDLAEVTSIVTSSTQDPHEYEATAQDRLALDGADIVIENGGGYDPFIDTLLASGGGNKVVLNAVDLSGLAPEEGEEHSEEEHSEEEHSEEEHSEEDHAHVEGLNEHVWYDFHAVEKLADELRAQLSELDPDNADAYQANYDALAEEIEALEASAEELRATAEGRGVVITEPVPVYLLSEAGLVVETPEEFSEAVEEGADVAPRVLQETLDLFDTADIAVLAYNTQASDATTEQVLAAAEGAGVPVVDFTETLPDGQTWVEWQQANLDNLAGALSST